MKIALAPLQTELVRFQKAAADAADSAQEAVEFGRTAAHPRAGLSPMKAADEELVERIARDADDAAFAASSNASRAVSSAEGTFLALGRTKGFDAFAESLTSAKKDLVEGDALLRQDPRAAYNLFDKVHGDLSVMTQVDLRRRAHPLL